MTGNKRIVLLGGLTLFLFPIAALALEWLINGTLNNQKELFSDLDKLWLQIILGVSSGYIFGMILWRFIQTKLMRDVRNKYGNLIGSLKLNLPEIIFVSLCAGIGEEWFFRGFLQQFTGVILTSIIFVFIHGYLNPFENKVIYYGILMTLVIMVIGAMSVHIGIYSAMISHALIDVVLFYKLTTNSLKVDV
ncbi:MAG: CPBP family intramembrane metalloprotease [Flavobacteriales bacterium]|nr:CPBP family intramembrane metalloprotease [Flavobacteriales bacterium]